MINLGYRRLSQSQFTQSLWQFSYIPDNQLAVQQESDDQVDNSATLNISSRKLS